MASLVGLQEGVRRGRVMTGDVLIVIGGLLVVSGLAYVIIRYAIEWAASVGVSGTFVGLTILSIGTSIPEIAAHVVGSLRILEDPSRMNTLSALVIGNNIGSDVFQQNVVVPVVGLISVLRIRKRNLTVEVGALIAAAVLVWLLSLGGWLARWEGGGMVVAYLLYLGHLYRQSGRQETIKRDPARRLAALKALAVLLGGLCVLGVIADRVLDAATRLVATLPVSASLFGVVVLGVASALPELSTSLVAVLKRRQGMSAGILIGSNITNPLFGIGLGALLSGYTVPSVVIWYDLPIKVATGVLLYWFLARREVLGRVECATLLALYLLYILLRPYLFPQDVVAGMP